MVDNWEDVRRAHEADDLAFGTVESWNAYVSLGPPRSLFPTPRAKESSRVLLHDQLGGFVPNPESASASAFVTHTSRRDAACFSIIGKTIVPQRLVQFRPRMHHHH